MVGFNLGDSRSRSGVTETDSDGFAIAVLVLATLLIGSIHGREHGHDAQKNGHPMADAVILSLCYPDFVTQ